MKLGETLYAKNRREWRAWLSRHHKTAPEIWLIYYKKSSGKPRIPYNHAVEEALCYGWIDSLTKPVDGERWAQRFSPRRPTSRLSEMNRERVRRLIKAKRMTKAGLAKIAHVFDHARDTKRTLPLEVPPIYSGGCGGIPSPGATIPASRSPTAGSASAGSWRRAAGPTSCGNG